MPHAHLQVTLRAKLKCGRLALLVPHGSHGLRDVTGNVHEVGAGVLHRSGVIAARSVTDTATMVVSDRSSLALLIHDAVAESTSELRAAGQFSIAFGHFPWLGSRTSTMHRAFSKFADYWRNERRQLVASE